ncbi:transcriptional regulator [Acinetobacter sp. ME22]|uniref:transcriptional regulator n=1 Tax=Acinetobacter sp. ME22 TaxID=2904802 RepID=UPI001EDA33E8|nr:transcriptional regulator [Acinetobacter sp. ME22]MCG2575246.1 transcriptional regulator [Acinetobacter sp. ME22]
MQDLNLSNQATPLRVSQKTTCQMLDLSSEGLRKLMAKDPTFPKPYKAGQTRQAPVYFDYAELVQWHNNQKQTNAVQSA